MSATPIVRGPPAATPRPASTSSDALDFRSKVMKKIATWTVLACATSLAGCTGAAYSNRSLESVHQPVVRNNLYQFDVATADGELPPSEQGRLQGWLDAMGVRYGDRIALDDTSAYGASSAQARSEERRGGKECVREFSTWWSE